VQVRPSSICLTVFFEYAAHVRLQLAALVSWLGVARPDFNDYPSILAFKSMAHSLGPFHVLHIKVEASHRSGRRTRNRIEKMRDKCRTALTHDLCRLYPYSSFYNSVRNLFFSVRPVSDLPQSRLVLPCSTCDSSNDPVSRNSFLRAFCPVLRRNM
jgi:hypothetical protein